MRPTVLLFDIDGTLLTCGGAGQRAMRAAFAGLHGAPEACAFPYAGRTDRGILREALARAQSPTDEATLLRTAAAYLAHLGPALAESAGFAVLPGVPALLDALPPSRDRAVGLGTGNLAAGAAQKLAHAGLADRFSFGGYGSDHADRARALALGAQRGAARLGRAATDCRVVVIGDTPRDVAAAHAIGAECLAVATGPYPAEALAGAHTVVDRLSDPAAVAALR